jgi:hypothetical protein
MKTDAVEPLEMPFLEEVVRRMGERCTLTS